jgi:ATP-dependent Clp protease protease subunit
MTEGTEQEHPQSGESSPIRISDEFKSIALIGDLTEAISNEVIFSLLLLNQRAIAEYLTFLTSMGDPSELTDEQMEDLRSTIDMYVSTNGGSADEMFGIYDVMRMVKDDGVASIATYGVGKVMSAGVLLLAAGTKGQRHVGKYCRIMIHSVIGGHTGPMHQLENEFAEVKKIQDTYIQALAEETDMTEEYLRSLLEEKTNIYLSAEEAVKLGIADVVF